ncbi:hypothetical protein ANN_01819 [Periplaneta americana]|uniref:Uncharacterized protein n=1 Tax=Periplaneta americana TaxID=6978 RepID=A0ABQ8TXL6_PERAM|nr:hypothetical protein ANN_01819 [Periplaneta americana]
MYRAMLMDVKKGSVLEFHDTEIERHTNCLTAGRPDTYQKPAPHLSMTKSLAASSQTVLAQRTLKLMHFFSAVKNLKVRIYKTITLSVVLYGCETWTLTLRDEHRLRVFENKVLRKIFGAKRDEVTGECRKLHNTELHTLYSSPNIIRNIKFRRLRWAGHVTRMGESRNAYRVLVGRPEGERPLGRPRRRWEDNIKMDLREVEYDDRDWINLAQDRDQWRAYLRATMNLRFITPLAERLEHRLFTLITGVQILAVSDGICCGQNRYSVVDFRGTLRFYYQYSTIDPLIIIIMRCYVVRLLSCTEGNAYGGTKNYTSGASLRDEDAWVNDVNGFAHTCYIPCLPQMSRFNVPNYVSYVIPVALYGCETWTLTLREEQRLRVFENKFLRKIFGAKRDEVTGEWRKLHNAELHALYSSPDIIRNIKSRRLRWAGHVARIGESRNAYTVLVERSEEKRPLRRPRRRWEDNIKMDLREVGYYDRDWINLAQDRDRWQTYVRVAMNLRVP